MRSLNVLTLIAVAAVSAHAQVGPRRQGDLTLTLACRDPAAVTLEIRNNGTTDTTLRLGSVLGNGLKYMVHGLDLIVKMRGGGVDEYRYSPRHYPAAIGGSLSEWLQPLPTRAAYRMSATPDDFFNGRQRLAAFPAGAQLSLRWTIGDPGAQARLLAYWSGELISDPCPAA